MQSTHPDALAPTLRAPAHDPKRCACGLVHDAYAWASLPWVGVQDFEEGSVLHLRNCRCGSTLAVEVAS